MFFIDTLTTLDNAGVSCFDTNQMQNRREWKERFECYAMLLFSSSLHYHECIAPFISLRTKKIHKFYKLLPYQSLNTSRKLIYLSYHSCILTQPATPSILFAVLISVNEKNCFQRNLNERMGSKLRIFPKYPTF